MLSGIESNCLIFCGYMQKNDDLRERSPRSESDSGATIFGQQIVVLCFNCKAVLGRVAMAKTAKTRKLSARFLEKEWRTTLV